MTNVTLDRESKVEILPVIDKSISLVLMAIALVGSVFLLKWAVNDNLSKTEVVEPTQITALVREKQLNCLAKNIYYEAGGEPFEGMAAVAQVTINRAESGKFPDDICKVVYQKDDHLGLCQFSWYCTAGTTIPPIHKASYNESMEVAKKVLLEGFRLPGLTTALYFHGAQIDPGWKKKRVAKIGNHIFYE